MPCAYSSIGRTTDSKSVEVGSNPTGRDFKILSYFFSKTVDTTNTIC